jgi:hypothetical protein
VLEAPFGDWPLSHADTAMATTAAQTAAVTLFNILIGPPQEMFSRKRA